VKFGTHSFSEVGRIGHSFDDGVKWMPDCVKSHIKGETNVHNEVPGPLFRPNGASLIMSSRISCIRLGPNLSPHAPNDSPIVGNVLYPLIYFYYFFFFIHYLGFEFCYCVSTT
jgi:hypothetical protein